MRDNGVPSGAGSIRNLSVRIRKRIFLCLIMTGGFFPWTWLFADSTDNKGFRLGFSSTTFVNVNQNDAMAAIKVWASLFARNLGIPTDPIPYLLNDVGQIREAVRTKRVDTIALSVNEFWALRDDMDARNFIVGVTDGDIYEAYILLVHPESGLKKVADLMGRTISILQNSRMNLAGVWLETIMAEGGCGMEKKCRITHAPNIAKAVLPLFFKQIEACLVNERGFMTMCELNPQMKRLKILASSPKVVPAGFCFRKGYNSPIRESIMKNIGELVATPAGKQIMTLFQTDGLAIQSPSCLESAFELLERHQKLCGDSGRVNDGPP